MMIYIWIALGCLAGLLLIPAIFAVLMIWFWVEEQARRRRYVREVQAAVREAERLVKAR